MAEVVLEEGVAFIHDSLSFGDFIPVQVKESDRCRVAIVEEHSERSGGLSSHCEELDIVHLANPGHDIVSDIL